MTACAPAHAYRALITNALQALRAADADQVAAHLGIARSTASRYLARCHGHGDVVRSWDLARHSWTYGLPEPMYRFLITVHNTNSSASAAHCSDLTLAAIKAGMRPFTAVELATRVWTTQGSAHDGVYGIEFRGQETPMNDQHTSLNTTGGASC